MKHHVAAWNVYCDVRASAFSFLRRKNGRSDGIPSGVWSSCVLTATVKIHKISSFTLLCVQFAIARLALQHHVVIRLRPPVPALSSYARSGDQMSVARKRWHRFDLLRDLVARIGSLPIRAARLISRRFSQSTVKIDSVQCTVMCSKGLVSCKESFSNHRISTVLCVWYNHSGLYFLIY